MGGRTISLFQIIQLRRTIQTERQGNQVHVQFARRNLLQENTWLHTLFSNTQELLDEKTENNKENSSKRNSNLVRNLTQSNGNTNSRSMDSVMSIHAPRPRESTKRKNTRGSAIRKSYTLDFKIKTLKLLDEVESQKDIKHKTDYAAKKKEFTSL